MLGAQRRHDTRHDTRPAQQLHGRRAAGRGQPAQQTAQTRGRQLACHRQPVCASRASAAAAAPARVSRTDRHVADRECRIETLTRGHAQGLLHDTYLLCGLRRLLGAPASAGTVRDSASSSSGRHGGWRLPALLPGEDCAPFTGPEAVSSAAASAAGPSIKPLIPSPPLMSLDKGLAAAHRDTNDLRREPLPLSHAAHS